jgi:hypothetical protein
MAIERVPSPTIGTPANLKQYRPQRDLVLGYHTVRRGGNETLRTVAQAHSLTVEELIAFNFPGAVIDGRIDPPVVNWYLRHHIAFKCPETRDGKNRRFRGGEQLAIPRRTVYIEITEPLVITANPPPVSGLWFGGGYKAGTTFGVVGIETTQVVCIAATGRMGFTATISGTRFPALGLGASGGPLVILITSMRSPGQLSDLMTGGGDFSIAIGAKLDTLVRGGRYARAAEALGRFAARYGRAGRAGLRAAEQLVKYNSQIADIAKMLGMKFNHYEPQVFSLGSPWGGFGAEASVHFTVSQFHVNAVIQL